MNLLRKVWHGVKPYCTWKMLPIAGTIWILTNGVWYALAVIPHVPLWLRGIAIAWLGILYLPFTPEKIVIVVFAPMIYRFIYKEEFKKEAVKNERKNGK